MRLHQHGADRREKIGRPSMSTVGAPRHSAGAAVRPRHGRRRVRVPPLGGWELDLGARAPVAWWGRRSHSSGRLSDRPWIVIVVVVEDARAMTLGTGDDVAVLILDPALATALRTDFHAACPVPSRQHRIFETPVPHRQSRLASAPPPRKLSSSFESHRSGRTGCFSRIARYVDQRRVTAGIIQT
jgi:hypothetical protein